MPPPVRAPFAAAVPPSGRVLVAGGFPWGPSIRRTARHRPAPPPLVFDPASGQWSQLSRFEGVVGAYDAVLLPDGRVLVNSASEKRWTWEEAADRWAPVPSPPFRVGLLAVPAAGKVLGFGTIGDEPTRVLSFDPSSGAWTALASPGWSLGGALLAALPNGRVLAVGGATGFGPSRLAAEYDPALDTWQYVAPELLEKYAPAAVAFEDGLVAVVGTPGAADEVAVVAEIYDSATRKWTQAPDLTLPTSNIAEGGFLEFPMGSQLLVARAGRYALVARAAPRSSEPPFAALLDPRTKEWFPVDPPRRRSAGKALTLPSGEVLLVGEHCLDCPGGEAAGQLFSVEEP